MLDRLPIYIDPISFAERGKRLSGAIQISELDRLSDLLFDKSGLVDVIAVFDKQGSLAIMQGEIKADLALECQACLGQLVWSFDKRFKLGLVTTLEQADKLANDCEPFIVESEKVLLSDLIEDELLLAIPDFPRHQHECSENGHAFKETVEDNKEPSNSNNPFSVLAQLKNTGD